MYNVIEVSQIRQIRVFSLSQSDYRIYIFIQASFNHLLFCISDELVLRSSLPNIHRKYDKFVDTASSSMTTISSHLSEITDKLDSNIVLAESLLDMLDSLNDKNNNSSTIKTSLLHMYIRQFLIDFDTRIRLDRNRRKSSKQKHKKVIR